MNNKHLKTVGPIRHCEPPPAHRCPRRRRRQQQRRQRQRVTVGTAMAPWNGPNNLTHSVNAWRALFFCGVPKSINEVIDQNKFIQCFKTQANQIIGPTTESFFTAHVLCLLINRITASKHWIKLKVPTNHKNHLLASSPFMIHLLLLNATTQSESKLSKNWIYNTLHKLQHIWHILTFLLDIYIKSFSNNRLNTQVTHSLSSVS